MKKIFAIAALMILAACEPTARPASYTVLPEELKDCRFFRLSNKTGGTITVARCANSTTAVREGNKPFSESITVSN